MPPNSYFYDALTVDAFMPFVCPWIDLVNYWCILHSFASDSFFVPYSSELPLEKTNKVDEKNQSNFQNPINSQALEEKCSVYGKDELSFQDGSARSDEFLLE